MAVSGLVHKHPGEHTMRWDAGGDKSWLGARDGSFVGPNVPPNIAPMLRPCASCLT